MSKIEQVKVSSIRMDDALQPRASITDEAVAEYAQAMADGVSLPPCLVVREGKTHWLCDGFHRVAAAKRIRRKTVECQVVVGDKQHAIWLASAANKNHGVRRTNADKRRAVLMALSVKGDAPYREIADHCAVTHEMVRQLKAQVDAVEEVERGAQEAAESATQNRGAKEIDAVGKAMVSAESVIARAIRALDGTAKAIAALCNTKHAVFVNAQSVMNDLRNANLALKHGLPYEKCPLCGGEGCETCRKSGWVSKRQWDLIPKTQRKA